MITINGKTFHDIPGSCATCPFFMLPGHGLQYDTGFCNLFMENHKTWINPPKRCMKLFRKAFKSPEGSKLVIVYNEGKED